jgi:hypothetical protein
MLAVLATAASAQTIPAFKDGNGLLAECEGTQVERLQCIGYTEGVADSFEAA